MNYLKPALWCVVSVLVFGPGLAVEAASLYMDPTTTTLPAGDVETLAVRLDVSDDEDCVNAVDAIVEFSGPVEVIDTSIGQSIFSIWVERPQINRENKQVTFAGGIPNGYCGRIAGDPRLSNVLMEIIVRAPLSNTTLSATETAQFNFTEQTTAYLNDGFGTNFTPALYGAEFVLSPQAASVLTDPWREAVESDTTPPAPFSVVLDTNPSGKYYVTFNTVDKQTGVDHYEVMESPTEQFGLFMWGRANAPWITARSPHVLGDQSLNSVIYVKAVDKAGNEYIATLIPDESLRSLSSRHLIQYSVIVGLLLLGIMVGVILHIYFSRRRRSRSVTLPIDSASENNSTYADGE